ncbi:hypothetical protein ES695_03345 [Candidatus Atribacteria bacterium 1244-E10-H5-B2]|nr:MAG: hypothetical protein ES695_03345 [Candidatus Atribacteria bacterium 1244-E10-H5-B2]
MPGGTEIRKDYRERRLKTLEEERLLTLDLVRIVGTLRDSWDLSKLQRRNLRWFYEYANQLRVDVEEKIAVLGVSKKYRKKRIKSAKERLLAGPFSPRKEDIRIVDSVKRIIKNQRQYKTEVNNKRR